MKSKKRNKLELVYPCLNLIIAFLSIFIPAWISYYTFHSKSKNLEAYLVKKSYFKRPGFPDNPLFHISYREKEAKDILYMRIRFINHGDTITIDDFKSPLMIKFKNIVEIIDAGVIDRIPTDVSCAASFNQYEIVISKTLLNKNDSFTVEVFCSISSIEDDYVQNVCGRIVGLHQIKFHPGAPGSVYKKTLKSLFIAIIPLLLLYITIWRIMDAYDYRHKHSIEISMYIGMLMILGRAIYIFILMFDLY